MRISEKENRIAHASIYHRDRCDTLVLYDIKSLVIYVLFENNFKPLLVSLDLSRTYIGGNSRQSV